jgi:hypothetical protein
MHICSFIIRNHRRLEQAVGEDGRSPGRRLRGEEIHGNKKSDD